MLRVGDVIEAEIDGLGVLRNTVTESDGAIGAWTP